MNDFWVKVIGFGLLFAYLGGMIEVVRDDYRYDTKDAVIAFVIPPYPVYIGAYSMYRRAFDSKKWKEERRCLKRVVSLGGTYDRARSICL